MSFSKRLAVAALLILCGIMARASVAISRTGALAPISATSGTFSATATGDLKLVIAFNASSTTTPSVPAGWTAVAIKTGTTSAYTIGCNISSSSGDTTSGTWTNATMVGGVSYSHTAAIATSTCNTDALTARGTNSATSTSEAYNAVLLINKNTTSWVLGVGMDVTSTNCTPTGMTIIGTQTGTGPAFILNDTNGPVNVWSGGSCTVTSSQWLTLTIEIRPPCVRTLSLMGASNC